MRNKKRLEKAKKGQSNRRSLQCYHGYRKVAIKAGRTLCIWRCKNFLIERGPVYFTGATTRALLQQCANPSKLTFGQFSVLAIVSRFRIDRITIFWCRV